MATNDNTIENILDEIKTTQILIRTNNLLLSRFIMQLQEVRKELNLPKKNTFFKFEIDEDDYDELVAQFGTVAVNKALYRLDRLLLTNKQELPNNIKRYVARKLKDKEKNE